MKKGSLVESFFVFLYIYNKVIKGITWQNIPINMMIKILSH